MSNQTGEYVPAQLTKPRTMPGVLSREGQKQLVADATGIIAKYAGDPEQAKRR